ncbi:uncharacterized protein Z518_05137 [Rhinocladiella mackenziei CBS 650.93]|uniref:Uncharacterized protein n=1 Tax=Rhinocladiella mackenziei CBS 650.93 TaxID=1442369 RepID=A0A0D2J5F9_9EURO|nr:uncharacterized protein Z518_05137 [Rhinocladiella mackenziei CBS 650.93]KIX04270.1 hypothetical protein Z518_05137 [Rhinocladiella mackenziei CBS 650.93]
MPTSQPNGGPGSEISIPVPISFTSTTNSLPPSSSQALIAHLRATGNIPELSTLLADSLARTGWTDRVRALSLELLRNGTCDTFPELMSEVLRRAKIPKSQQTNAKSGATGLSASKTTAANGTSMPAANGINGNGAIALSKEWSGGPDGLPDVRIPEVTVEAAVEFLKEKIKDVVEPVDDESD